MNKKTQKTLVAAVAATMGAGIVAPVVQAVAVDYYALALEAIAKAEASKNIKDIELAKEAILKVEDVNKRAELSKRLDVTAGPVLNAQLKNAYDLVQAALASKKLEDLKPARLAVDEMSYLLQDYKNTWSTALDPVTQPYLVAVVDPLLAMMDDANKINQTALNEVRAIINGLPQTKALKQYILEYSATQDLKQSEYGQKALALAKKAKETGLQADLDAAKAIYEDLAKIDYSPELLKAYEENIKTVIVESEVIVEYNAVVAKVEAQVAAYEALANGDLTTQELIDAAYKAEAAIDLTGLNNEDTLAFSNRIGEASIKVDEAQKALNEAKEYKEVLDGVEAKVAAYEAATADLSTQELINAAKELKAVINLEVGLKAEDAAKFQARIDVVDARVAEAQKVVDYAKLKDGVEAKVAAYEAATADLSTQELVNEAKKLAVISLEGLTAEDTAAFQARIDAANAKVTQAEENLAKIKVESVSAITTTTVKVQLVTAPETTLVDADAAKFEVVVGQVKDAVKNVTRDMSDESGKTYILTLTDSLVNKEGNITVNGTAPKDKVATNSDFDFDFKKSEVVSVEALSSTKILVRFSEKMNKATSEDITNYTLSDPSGVVIASPKALTGDSTATLQANKTDVLITLGSSDLASGLANSKFYLTVNDGTAVSVGAAKDLNNNVTAKTIVEFQGKADVDTTGSELINASYNKATGALKLRFNEPVSLSDADIAEAKISVGGVKLTESDYTTGSGKNAEVTINLTTATKNAINALAGDLNVTLEKGAFKDVAANDSIEKSVVATIATAPVLQSASYDENTNKITLTFDKAVDVSTLTNLTNIQVKVGATGTYTDLSGASVVETTEDGTTVEITPAAPVFRGTAVATDAKLKLKAGAIVDVADAQANLVTEVALNFVNDIVAANLVSANYQNVTNVLTLTFDEDVKASTVLKGNIKFYDADSTSATALSDGSTTISTVDGKTIIVNLAGTDITNVAGLDPATTKIELSNVTDITGNKMTALTKADSTGLAVEVKDLIPPTVDTANTAVENANVVKVVFDETVDKATAENINNYSLYLTAAPAQKLEVKSATLRADGKTVDLVTATQLAGAAYTIAVSGIKDIAGNAIVENGSANSDTFTGSAVANIAPSISGAASFEDTNKDGKVSAGDKVIIPFTKSIKFAGTVSEADFVLGTSTTPTFGVNAQFAVSATDPSKVEVTLGTNPSLVVAGTKTTVNLKAENDIVDLLGKKAVPAVSPVVIAGDETAPSISKAVFTDVNDDNKLSAGDYIDVVFNENVNVDASKLIDPVTQKINAFTFAGISDIGNATVEIVDSKTVRVKFGDTTSFGSFAIASNVTYDYTKNAVADLFGNKPAGNLTKALSGVTDNGAVITSAVLYDVTGNGANAGDRLVLTFDKNVNIGNASQLADDFALNTGSSLDLSNGDVARYNNNQVIITLGTNARIAANPTIDISTNTIDIKDVYGNDAKPASAPIAITVGTNSVAPVLQSVVFADENENGSVNGTDTLTFTFSEAMDKNTVLSETELGTSKSFGSSPVYSWNEAGTALTVTLGAGTTIANGDSFNPTANIVDAMGKADATAFAPTVSIADDAIGATVIAGAVTRTGATTGTVKFTSNEAGSYYYAIVAKDAPIPTINTSGAGTACTVGETTITNPTGLTSGAKDLYVVVKDAAGNVSDLVKIAIVAES